MTPATISSPRPARPRLPHCPECGGFLPAPATWDYELVQEETETRRIIVAIVFTSCKRCGRTVSHYE